MGAGTRHGTALDKTFEARSITGPFLQPVHPNDAFVRISTNDADATCLAGCRKAKGFDSLEVALQSLSPAESLG